MKEVGMQFQQWEVKALLEGRKTRLTVDKLRPPCQVGDVIWVRETWQNSECFDNSIQNKFAYKANEGDSEFAEQYKIRWNPSTNMQRKAARLFLKVKSVKVQRLQDITEIEAQQEGFTAYFEQCCAGKDVMSEYELSAKEQFLDQFKNHEDNPWVWIIEFEILQDYKKERLKCQKL